MRYGMPLVNAHTYNSRMRYWAYEDSSAYTPNIKYKFFTIVDGWLILLARSMSGIITCRVFY